ncbi:MULTISPECIES: PPK2 family polyphosphate kinase [unclassified Herbaspirillum]|uniref:PPK2 family polyphosphate kinase n=1 Tax=unclassified Herbaspirillum TaxID=2624150 RepID=UPI000E2F510F|nr:MULTISPECIES: PPK2 family polyphosphate kinase [unclassified Herbaspirillum]RFB71119.1 polyphosphate kinase 2 family protein [Herbaspirillum sp. 3R-3a1]TFI08354.1 polyphosphate kinase 2 family protein [Herbaspirillum sp. 3R11]TFI14769.1 polyphosphate kinase 2 family protein [Herbaspirillum sp. 3R-11]TFI24189.1 polyphosphate kinase 2 family protein [Herbaspirillum sp. 3C11]
MGIGIREQFRATKKQEIKDENAGAKPLSSGDKAADKLQVQTLAAQIAEQQAMLFAQHERKVLVVLQGMDTSGKDGTVAGVFGGVNPQGLRIVSYKAPSQLELQHDYLWRIHQQVPAKGELAIFNRSHYEDVLITRVHDWIDAAECKRRYAQINDFERLLSETGTVVLKFFLHISKDEQRARLQERVDDPTKHWKFELQDLEERKSWDDYQKVYSQAIQATDADHAPWYVIPSDSKTHRNLAIAGVVLETLQAMKLAFPPAKKELAGLKVK